jgi:hypothetical protein
MSDARVVTSPSNKRASKSTIASADCQTGCFPRITHRKRELFVLDVQGQKALDVLSIASVSMQTSCTKQAN